MTMKSTLFPLKQAPLTSTKGILRSRLRNFPQHSPQKTVTKKGCEPKKNVEKVLVSQGFSTFSTYFSTGKTKSCGKVEIADFLSHCGGPFANKTMRKS